MLRLHLYSSAKFNVKSALYSSLYSEFSIDPFHFHGYAFKPAILLNMFKHVKHIGDDKLIVLPKYKAQQ